MVVAQMSLGIEDEDDDEDESEERSITLYSSSEIMFMRRHLLGPIESGHLP